MRRTVLLFFSLILLSIPNTAHAGIIGTKCSNSGATLTNGGTKYVCKNLGGKLKWQKAPNVRSTKNYNNCILTRGWDPGPDANMQNNVNIQNYCHETFYPK
jgi:hypothetical protein